MTYALINSFCSWVYVFFVHESTAIHHQWCYFTPSGVEDPAVITLVGFTTWALGWTLDAVIATEQESLAQGRKAFLGTRQLPEK